MCWLNRRMATRIWLLMGLVLGLMTAAAVGLYYLLTASPRTFPVQVRLAAAEMDALYRRPHLEV